MREGHTFLPGRKKATDATLAPIDMPTYAGQWCIKQFEGEKSYQDGLLLVTHLDNSLQEPPPGDLLKASTAPS